jgi:hypothetical protein
VINTVYTYPANTVIGLAILLAGVPVFFMWRGGSGGRGSPPNSQSERGIHSQASEGQA